MRFKDFKVLTENDQSLQDKVERLRRMPAHKDKDEETLRRMAASWRTREADPKAKPKQTKLKPPVRSYHDDLDDKRYGETNEDWNKVNHHDKTDGLSQKAVNAYRRENPGSKLQTAVTTKPSKLKAGSKDAKRRKSFCARMSGNKGPMKDEKGRPTPKAKALARWNCEENIEQLEQALEEAKKDPCWKGYKQIGMKKKGGKQVPNCVPTNEDAFGTVPKRTKRPGSRPDRGHQPLQRYKTHLSPSGVMTNMDPEDDDYEINYGANGLVAKYRKDRGVDVKTGTKKVKQVTEHKKGVRAHKYTKKAKGTIDPLDPKKVKEVPGRKVVGPKQIKHLEKELAEAAAIMEGAKVDRMKAHIEKSERKLGHSKDEAESIAWATLNKRGYLDNKNKKKKKVKEHTDEQVCEFCGSHDHTSLDESGKASRSLCTSSKPDSELGASQLASCKSQGLRARAGEKSHKIGKTRIKVGGHRIKGQQYGGPLPDWSEE